MVNVDAIMDAMIKISIYLLTFGLQLLRELSALLDAI